MECNKDEAIRAREIAERKMQNSDFVGGKKFALKSQKLYPNLDTISMILAICEVHCSAQNNMIGSVVDWYEVLQIEKTADETTIKRQYRKLALLLHPDKNKFAGAEAAFKLIGEANRVLSNKTTKSVFDLKVKAFMKTSISKSKPSFHQTSGGSVVNKHQNTQGTANQQFMPTGPQKKSQTSQRDLDKIWTLCPHCRTSVECFKFLLGKQMPCRTCNSTFTAYETGAPVNHSNTSSSRPECFNSKGNSGSFHMSCEAAGKAAEFNGGSDRHYAHNNMPVPPAKAGFPDSKSKQTFNDDDGVSVDAQTSSSKSDVKKPVLGLMANTSRGKNNKRGKPEVVDSSQNSDGVGDANVAEVNQDKRCSEGNYDARESCQRKRNVSYTGLYEESEFSKSSKMPHTGNGNIKNKNEAGIDKGLKDDDDNACATSMNEVEKDVKHYNGTSHEKILSNKKRKLKKQSTDNLVEEDVVEFEEKDSDIEPDTSPINYECPEPEFSNFYKDKEKSCFDVDQIWAVYDTVDAMPRFYARVRRVISTDFTLRITWLESDTWGESNTKWADEGLPTACGDFKHGNTEVITEHLMFSHQMRFELGKSRTSFVIYPRAAEIWALFRNWDISWADDPEKHKPYKFDFVVILSDFDQKDGVKVAYLKKLRGFVSLFRRVTQDGESSPFHIPPGNLFQFSHRIPAFQMSGTERDDGLEGSYELDTASLPIDIDELDDLADGEVRNKRKYTTSNISFKQYSECHGNLKTAFGTVGRNDISKKPSLDDAKQALTNAKSSKAFLNKAHSYQESGTSASNQDDDCIIITQNPTTVLRRSPRGLSSKKSSNRNVT